MPTNSKFSPEYFQKIYSPVTVLFCVQKPTLLVARQAFLRRSTYSINYYELTVTSADSGGGVLH